MFIPHPKQKALHNDALEALPEIVKTAIITTLICSLAIPYAVFCILNALDLKHRRFFIMFYSLIILGLVCIVQCLWYQYWYISGLASKDYVENIESGTYKIPMLVLVFVLSLAIATFNLSHWLFAAKYWTISVKISSMLKDKNGQGP